MSEQASDLTSEEQSLIAAARGAMAHAHAPYSRFAVGAALRLTDGTILTGANFENASYGLSLCAETVAIAAANAQGRLRDSPVITPCGRCRQIIKEAQDMGGRALTILCAAPSGEAVARHRLDDLLPHAFGPGNLGIGD